MVIVHWMSTWALSLCILLAQPSTSPTGTTPPPAPPKPTTGATGPVGPAPASTPQSNPPVSTGTSGPTGLPTATGFVPAPAPIIKSTPGVPKNCQCVSVTIEGLTAKQQGQPVHTALAGVPLDLEPIVKVQCSRPCQPGVIGKWHITFVPGAQGDRFLVNPRTTARKGLQAVLEINGEGAYGSWTPPGPGKAIIHFNGRATCDDVVCEQRLHAAIELDVVLPALTDQQKQDIIDATRARLPVIPGGQELLDKDAQWRADLHAQGQDERADRAVPPAADAYDRAVGEWFGQSTGWTPGDQYTQTFDMPGGCGLLRGVKVVSSAFQDIASWAFGEEGLPCGFPASVSRGVFGRPQQGSVIARNVGDNAKGELTLTLPIVDAFFVEIRYIDAAGQTRTINTRCTGTSGPHGAVAAGSAPGPSMIRVSLCNVDGSRLGGDDSYMLATIVKMIGAHFGGWYKGVNSTPAFDAQGRETQYSDVIMSGVNVPASVIADLLKPLADALGAKITVNGQNIVIQGADVPSREPVLPERLGGQRTR